MTTAPADGAQTTKEEMRTLLREIRNDTASQDRIVKFIRIAKTLLGEA